MLGNDNLLTLKLAADSFYTEQLTDTWTKQFSSTYVVHALHCGINKYL